jgi:hypothetical protein
VDKAGDSEWVISSSETLDFSFSISFYQEKEMERKSGYKGRALKKRTFIIY